MSNIIDLCPVSFSRYLTSSLSMTQYFQRPQACWPRVFRVINADCTRRTAIIADTLEDLMKEVRKGHEICEFLCLMV